MTNDHLSSNFRGIDACVFFLPDYKHRYDLFSAEDCTVFAGERRLISTDISIAVPKGYYGRVASRSGLALKAGIETGAGVVDPDYR